MSDLISRQDAIKAIEDLQDCYNGFSDSYDKACIIGVLEELPAAQQTTCKYWDTESDFCTLYRPSAQPEIIRCKDCKHWDDVPADETQDHECHLFDGNKENIRIATPSDWFCPKGERREE